MAYDRRFASAACDVLEGLVACLLSDYVFETASKQGAHRGALIRLLKLYAAIPLHGGGRVPAALLPQVAELELNENSAESVRRALGVSFGEERATWEALRESAGLFAAVPSAQLAHYVDPCLWPVVAAIVRDGPGVYSEHVQRVLRTYAAREVRATVRRPTGGPISQGALNTLRAAARRLVVKLPAHALHSDHPAAEHLKQWTGEPLAIASVRSRAARATRVTDPSAPTLRELRLVVGGLGEQIRAKLKVNDLHDEQDAIEALAHVGDRGLFRLLRNRALILTLAFGPRVRSVSRLQVRDLIEGYRHPELLGVEAALRLYPDKKGQPIERLDSALKPLPPEALQIYRSLLAFYRTVLGTLPSDTPLFLTYLAISTGGKSRARGMTPDGIRCLLGGTRQGARPMKALLPQGTDPHVGYTPHNVRAAACQLLQHPGASAWCEAHLIDPARRTAMAEALLDHFLDSSMLALYSGDATAGGRERLSGWATSIICELLLTELGARKQPDLDAYKRVLVRQGQVTRELSALQREIGDLRRSAAALARSGKQLDAVLLVTLDVGLLEDRRWQLTHEQTELRERAGALEQRENWRAVPDAVERVEHVDFAGLRQVPTEVEVVQRKRRRVPKRDWLTRSELAEILGCSTSTITRWVRDGIPELLDRKGRAPWALGQPPIVAFNDKRRVFWVPGLNRAALFDTHRKQGALLETLLGEQPVGWRSSPVRVPAAARPARYRNA